MISYENGLVVRAKYDYDSQEAEDLNFRAGEQVLVVEQINDQWFKGQLHGKSGIFPQSFVEREGIQTTTAAFNFPAECDSDLGLIAGEKLIVRSYVDDNWVCLVNSQGWIGNAPRNFLSEFVIDRDDFSSISFNSTPSTIALPSAYAQPASDINSFGLNNSLSSSGSRNGFQSTATVLDDFQFGTSTKSSSQNAPKVSRAPLKAFEPPSTDNVHSDIINPPKKQGLFSAFTGGSGGMRRAKSTFFEPKDMELGSESESNQKNGSGMGLFGSLSRSSSHSDLNASKGKMSGPENLRENAITELITTEKLFSRSLDLFAEVFPASDYHWGAYRINYRSLCGNLNEVRMFSKAIVSDFERAKLAKENFGGIFLQNSQKLTQIFTDYCTNFEEVPKLIEQYCVNKEIQRFFDKGIQAMRKQGSSHMNIGSFLLQPIQRVTRYPLLLGEISKHTPESHPDKSDLTKAVAKLHDVVESINQNKRTKEVVQRYKSSEPSTIKNVFSKLTVHSLKKKADRFSTTVTRKFSSPLVDDAEFARLRVDFKNVEKQLSAFQGSVSSHNRTLALFSNSILAIVNDFSGLLQEKFGANRLFKEHLSVCMRLKELCSKHALSVDNNILKKVARLESMFTGPNNLIKKRDDKLLDYESLLSAAGDGGQAENNNSLYTAKGNYMALNDQLKEELPKFNSLVQRSLADLSVFLLRQRKEFLTTFCQYYESYSRQNLTAISGGHKEIRDVFERKHTEIASKITSQVSFVPAVFASSTLRSEFAERSRKVSANGFVKKSKLSSERRQSLVNLNSTKAETQTEIVKEKIRSAYKHHDLYTCKSTYRSAKEQHLSLSSGDLVGVLQRKDPCGNANVWYVDNGLGKGLVDCIILTPVFPTTPMEENDPVITRQRQSVRSKRSSNSRPKSMFESSSETEREGFDSGLGMLAPVYLPGSTKQRKSGNIDNNISPIATDVQLDRSSIRIFGTSGPYKTQTVQNNASGSAKSSIQPSLDFFDPLSDAGAPDQFQSAPTNHSNCSIDSGFVGSPLTSLRNPTSSSHVNNLQYSAQVKPVKSSLGKYQVLWSHEASTQNEISLKEGLVIDVVEKSDLSGNPEWWLVREPMLNSEGYFPAVYLQSLPS